MKATYLRRLSVFVCLFAMLASTGLPQAQAQDGTPVWLPLVGNGATYQGIPETDSLLVFRTMVEVRTTAKWIALEKLDPVILDRGDNWALILVDDAQLEILARQRFNPTETDSVESLARHAVSLRSDVRGQLGAIFVTAAKARQQLDAVDGVTAAAAQTQVRTALQQLDFQARSFLKAAQSFDGDSDGLSDTAEGFWCTDPTRADSDFDGVKDGEEINRLKAWMNNQRSVAPSSGKPFQGWPHQKVNCFDDDSDSVPDAAERLELGLSADRESTDLDKFDDGQELFGLTFCTGQGGFCSYGALPRNADWGIITAGMPSWVKAPGNHPIVAAFPVPQINMLQPFDVQRVTVVTTAEGEMTQQTHSYSTSTTEGTSTGIEETITWNDWQETSRNVPDSQFMYQELGPQFNHMESSAFAGNYFGLKVTGATLGLAGAVGGALCVATAGIGCAVLAGAGIVGAGIALSAELLDQMDDLQDQAKANRCDPDAPYVLPKCVQNFAPEAQIGALSSNNQTQTVSTQDYAKGESGTEFAATGTGQIQVQPQIQISYPPQRPTTTESLGHSEGGAHTSSHTQYEEHTITNGEAFTTGTNWSTATAVDSAHAANLQFTYKVRNAGTEYAYQLKNLAFNIYVGEDPNPACTYFLATGTCGMPGDAVLFENFMPNEEKTFTSSPIPLSLVQMKAIDLGGPIRIVVEDFSFGLDEQFYQDAAGGGILIAMEDGLADGDEVIDNYLIPTWGEETVLDVLGRYFPHETDANGMMTAIWTPEYRSDTPSWCVEPRRPTDFPTKVLWCKHELSTADWWNVYTDGLGDGSEGFQDTQAVPGSVALFRFNKDSDLDGFSDRSEYKLGTDPKDASSYPRSEVLAGVHSIRSGNKVTSTLSLLNMGAYDAYGVEAVMIAPDDSVSITNNTVGGSGRVRAFKEVVVGSRILLQSPLPAAWTQDGHAVPAAAGYYTGNQDRAYTFTVANCGAGGCTVGAGTWTLNWNDGRGNSGALNFGAGYASPTFLPVGSFGMTLALYSGTVKNGESFTVRAQTPRDTFQYTINSEPFTAPLVIVSYNDPQGNHRFVLPTQAMDLTSPTEPLAQFAGEMLDDVGVELVTRQPFTPGANSVDLLVNNPAPTVLVNAKIFLEFVNISGTVVAEIPSQVTLPPGPTQTTVDFNSNNFVPAHNDTDDYIVLAFLTDYQGNILDTAGRPLSSFQVDPLPVLSGAAPTWDFGTVTQGSLIKHSLALANTGSGVLYTYLDETAGLRLQRISRGVGAADLVGYELLMDTGRLPVGPYDQTVTLHTSDPNRPTVSVHLLGNIIASTDDQVGQGDLRPLDVMVTVQGPRNQGDWVTFSHNLRPDPQSLHPVKIYDQGYATLQGVGRYATDFGQGTASYDVFGNGRDGNLLVSTGQTQYTDNVRIRVSGVASSGQNKVNVASSSGFGVGDKVLIVQIVGTGAGSYDLGTITGITGNQLTLQDNLQHTYTGDTNSKAQAIRVPQFGDVTVQSGGRLTVHSWNGDTGGVLAFFANGQVTVSGSVDANGSNGGSGASDNAYGANGGGYRGGNNSTDGSAAGRGESYTGVWPSERREANYTGGGGADGWDFCGGGGGYGTTGVGGWPNNGSGGYGYGGGTSGASSLAAMYFGGGGGGGRSGVAGGGGSGGGIVFVVARQLNISSGSLSANGGNGGGQGSPGQCRAGGGGAGGSIKLQIGSGAFGSNGISANGGGVSGVTEGRGGSGRIRIEYCESLSGTSSPAASTQKLNCYIAEQVDAAPYESARLNLPETVDGERTYAVQYGRRLVFAGAGEMSTTLRIPASMVYSATVDALLSSIGDGVVNFQVDIGNDGTWDWIATPTIVGAATVNSPDLTAAVNKYWGDQGSPIISDLDVPIKVSMSKAGQVLLTNMRLDTAGSKLRTVRLPAGVGYTDFILDFSVEGSGSESFSLSLDVGDNGSIDWSTSIEADLPHRLLTGNLATALNQYLSGVSGTGSVNVPIRIYSSASGPVSLQDYTFKATATNVDLTPANLTVGNLARGIAVNEGDQVTINAVLRNNGSVDSGPVTAAFFATVEGWGDWYIGSVFVDNVPAGASVPANLTWDTTGFSGDLPIKVVVNPYNRVAETSTTNNAASITVSIMPQQTNTLPGDCNGDSVVDAGDISALSLEIFDGDGAAPANAPGSTFAGDPIGCDANADLTIDAGDISCAVLLIFEGAGACTAR